MAQTRTATYEEQAGRRTGVLATTVRNLATQDVVMVAYHLYICGLVTGASQNAFTSMARQNSYSLFAVAATTLLLTRGELITSIRARSWVYRIGMFSSTAATYFALRGVLHALEPRLLDASLLAIDRAFFGHTPSVWMDKFVNHASVEWFSFFYYSHYFLLAGYLFPVAAADSGRRRYELLLGIVIVLCLGHALYTVVPGVGPFAYDAVVFQNPMVGGTWWGKVGQAVSGAGAEYDIFPSLHTAVPVFFSLQAIRFRHTPYYRRVWLLTCFFAFNIVISTMFLRWHYAIDVVAGLALASFAHWAAGYCWGRENAQDWRRGRQPVWFEDV